jgi:hypothetical protein
MLIHQCPQELLMVVPRKNQGLAKYTSVLSHVNTSMSTGTVHGGSQKKSRIGKIYLCYSDKQNSRSAPRPGNMGNPWSTGKRPHFECLILNA